MDNYNKRIGPSDGGEENQQWRKENSVAFGKLECQHKSEKEKIGFIHLIFSSFAFDTPPLL